MEMEERIKRLESNNRLLAFGLFALVAAVNGFSLTTVLGGAEISVTTALFDGETEIYSQSSSGQIITCGVEFNGTSHDFVHFGGSFGLMYFMERGVFPVLKINTVTFSESETMVRRKIKNAWLKSRSSSTLVGEWKVDTDGGKFLLVGVNALSEGLMIYSDLVGGGEVKIGFLFEGEEIDKVYKLEKIPLEEDAMMESVGCLVELMKRISQPEQQ